MQRWRWTLQSTLQSLSIPWPTYICGSAGFKGLSDGQEVFNVLQKSAAPEEFVGLFISSSAFSLTLKCHCYSGVAPRETIKKKTPLNPIYNLSAKLCVRGKLRWALQHIKRHWTASHSMIWTGVWRGMSVGSAYFHRKWTDNTLNSCQMQREDRKWLGRLPVCVRCD